MKNLVFFIILCACSISFAQETSPSEEEPAEEKEEEEEVPRVKKNEISLGAFNLVAFGAIDLSYERIINDNSSLVAEIFVHTLNREDESLSQAYKKDLSLTGKYKHFFSSTYAQGFYVHGFGMLSGGRHERSYFDSEGDYQVEIVDYNDFAIGFGAGGKFLSEGGFVLDISAGLGRNLFNEEAPTIAGQFNVNVGYRF